jgi:hypothetical protein
MLEAKRHDEVSGKPLVQKIATVCVWLVLGMPPAAFVIMMTLGMLGVSEAIIYPFGMVNVYGFMGLFILGGLGLIAATIALLGAFLVAAIWKPHYLPHLAKACKPLAIWACVIAVYFSAKYYFGFGG